MNLYLLLKRTAAIIFERGKKYFEEGNVSQLKLVDGRWIAKVAGTHNYSVEIEIDDTDAVTYFHCNCPFPNPKCKHIVAVTLTIMSQDETYDLEQCILDNSCSELGWQDLLCNATKEELLDFIIEYGSNNDFGDLVVSRFGQFFQVEIEAEIESLKEYFEPIYEANEDLYDGASDSDFEMPDVRKFMGCADHYYDAFQYDKSFCVLATVIDTCISGFYHVYFVAKECEYIISDACEKIELILNQPISQEFKLIIFNWIYKDHKEKYDCFFNEDNTSLENLFFSAAKKLKKYKEAHEFIDCVLKDKKLKFKEDSFLKHKMDFLRLEGKG